MHFNMSKQLITESFSHNGGVCAYAHDVYILHVYYVKKKKGTFIVLT